MDKLLPIPDAETLRPMLSVASILLTIIFVLFALGSRTSHRRYSLPPGPKPLPLIGNLLDIPLSEEWLTWQKYVHRYGDLVYLTALGRDYLLLGSEQAVTELLDKRPHFNSRPYLPMVIDLMNLGWVLTLMPYGDHWRRARRLMHSQLHAKAAENYRPTQVRGARRFVGDLLAAEPNRPIDKLSGVAKAVLPHMVRYNFAFTALDMIYGVDIRDDVMAERFVVPIERALDYFTQGFSPGQFLVDFIPLLKFVPIWFPGAGFQRVAREATAVGKAARETPFNHMKAEMARGSLRASMAAEMLKKCSNDEQLVKDVAGTVYMGGSDTTVSAITSYFLAMVTYPEVQSRAQAELDHVIGHERFADVSDKAHLPYLEAVIRECFRWLPVTPLGAGHVTTQDDEYRGYYIPKGTITLPFQWGFLHNSETYPEPFVFSPERYLTQLSDGSWKLREDVPDPRRFVFGFGRRICPGMHLAEQSMFAILTTVLQTLDVLRVKNHDGEEVIPDARMSSGVLSHPLPFAYALRARPDAQNLVNACVAVAGNSSS